MADFSKTYALDIFYKDARLVQHTFLLEVDSGSMTWSLTDVRLNIEGRGVHGPPGINAAEGAITGTAFWNRDKSTLWFVLANFLSIPYVSNKYPVGSPFSCGKGVVKTPMPGFNMGDVNLDWAVGTTRDMGKIVNP